MKANITEYLKGVCNLWTDLDDKELRELEKDCKKEGISVYTDYMGCTVNATNVVWRHKCSMCDEVHETVHDIEKDYLELGSAPCDEDTVWPSVVSCNAFIIQLENIFGKPPEGGRLYVKLDYAIDGYEVRVEWDSRFPLSYAYAFMLEGNTPEHWTAAAKKFIKEAKDGVTVTEELEYA